MKVEVFDIETKRSDQVKWSMEMSPEDRLSLCLDLIDLTIALKPTKKIAIHENDTIKWLELKIANAESNS